ncbi:hypothetical protein DM860_000109 [Cuscuta australis]|uniref:Copper transport protein n=1 Tax=Cuscuta australis TaxID=267555 RepID=A0A328CVU2_9ASTE|nr:hypothetical protein DM860_000109 [Cuscuta australis]
MAATNSTAVHGHMMHMTFFWGNSAEILFSDWPGYGHHGRYILSLAVVFALAVLVEWLSNSDSHSADSANRVAAALLGTAVYGSRMGLAYIVMLAVMSFNGGVFIAAVAGHALGFFLFRTAALKDPPVTSYVKRSDLTSDEQ